MLYDNDDYEKKYLLDVIGLNSKINIKKVIIFITSVAICFFILVGSFLLTYNKKINVLYAKKLFLLLKKCIYFLLLLAMMVVSAKKRKRIEEVDS